MSLRRAVPVAAVLMMSAAGAVLAEEAKDFLKDYKFEVRRVTYHEGDRPDPFEALFPIKSTSSRKGLKVRITSLKLSSVMSGKRKVAIFKELHGPLSYILVDNVLIGPDRKPIPGIAGSIHLLNDFGEYRVVLQQGVEKVDFTHLNRSLKDREEFRKWNESPRTAS